MVKMVEIVIYTILIILYQNGQNGFGLFLKSILYKNGIIFTSRRIIFNAILIPKSEEMNQINEVNSMLCYCNTLKGCTCNNYDPVLSFTPRLTLT